MIKKISKPKVLFVVPQLRSMFGEKGGVPGHPHVGIASLTAFLKLNQYPVKIFDEGIENDPQKLIALIKRYQPDIVGVTSFSYCYGSVVETIKRVANATKSPIIIGGPHVSAVKKEVLEENPEITFAVKMEGEYTLLELLQTLTSKQKKYSSIQGLIWRKGKIVVENSDRQLIKDVDSLPLPDYEAFDLRRYPCFHVKTMPILTSRGCPYGCNYCSVRLSMGRGFRARSPKNIISEIKHWNKLGFFSFDINDDCFTFDLKRAEETCDLIMKNKLKIKFQLYNGIRVDRVTPSLLKKLKKAGCTFIAYGCETGNQEVLNRIKKNITLEQVINAVNWTNKLKIKNAVNFIIGHEDETYENALDTLKFASNLPSNFVNFYNLVPYPGTQVFEWAKNKAKFLVPQDTFLKTVSYRDNSPIFETQDFTKEERQLITRKGFELYERKVLVFRLGPTLGKIFFAITRPKIIHKLMFEFALSNKIGNYIYQKISSNSRL